MTSSMLTGDRRWASGRRGGMTVLGKVAVPKPINLPSQKLENHGLDPNVEIVPKGTLSWGSRQSSSTANPWGSSTLSPKADSTGSPSHLSARPSSGGSGTRPSTGNSDRALEPLSSAWSSSSRPSSASGALTSNQTSAASLRPRSAETRPGSSQLSRFAESLPERSVAWGVGTAEKLGVATSRNDGFSLSSGDFPTLGSEKDNAVKNTDSQDHGLHDRPHSSSGGAAPAKDSTDTFSAGDVSVDANTRGGATNSWRRHNTPYGEDGIRPSMEKWQADPQGPPQPYPNTGIPPQHYDAWHGPPMNNHPGGVWYRGPPGGPPPYGPPVPPGGFPMEPYHFYRPQIPPTALPNPQPVPPPGAGPRLHHPKNGDSYRPHIPDAFVRPGMPIRPGFYPGPVPYESYYGPPMGYRNHNEREVPFMGRPTGPSAYNRHPGQNVHDTGDSHSRSCGYGTNGKALPSEHKEPSNPNDNRGPYRVLLKPHDCWDGKDEEQKWEETENSNLVEKGEQQRPLSWGDDSQGGYKNDEEVGLRRKPYGEKPSFQMSNYDGGSPVPAKGKSPENTRNAKAVEEISVKKVEHAASAFRENPAAPKDSSLIQKIEGLNAKTRASDVRHDIVPVSTREEQKNKSQAVNAGFNDSGKQAAPGSFYSERGHRSGINNPVMHGPGVSAGYRSIESTPASGAALSRRPTQGMHGRTDHHGKGRYNSQEGDGWRKKHVDSSVTSDVYSESLSNVHMQDHAPMEATEKSLSSSQVKNGGDSATSEFDPSDSQAQRAKMRELAKERVKQRQKEEEEREREQKAKALAKLEELNKRTVTVEGQQLDAFPTDATKNNQESQTVAEAPAVASKSGVVATTVVSDSNDKQISDMDTSRIEKATVPRNELLPERPKSSHREPAGSDGSMLMKEDDANAVHRGNAPQVYDASASKQKHVSYKQKQNIPLEKNFNEKPVTPSATEPLKTHTDVIVNAAKSLEVAANESAPDCGSHVPVNSNITAELSMQQRRKTNRGGKKHKVEETASTATLSSVVQKETVVTYASGESGNTNSKVSETELVSGAVQSETDPKGKNQASEKRISSPNEENHGKPNNQWKSQHSRKMQRGSQAIKSADKFHSGDGVIWAPVRSQNKPEVTGESSQKTVVDASSMKSEHQVQNNARNKRAELERYVPKPVAKEMAQQGSNQQRVAPSVDQSSVSHENVRRPDTGSQVVESAQVGSKTGDSRGNKQGKVHGSWRQRTSAEATIVHGSQGGQSVNSNKKYIEPQQLEKPDFVAVKEEPKFSDEWGGCDGWTMPEDPDYAVPPPPVVKDPRGKRHQYKGHKGTGNNHDHDHKKMVSGDISQSSVPPELSLKENVVGDRSSSHWQPKPQTFSASNQRGIRPNGGQNIGDETGVPGKKVASNSVAQAHQGQSSLSGKFEEAPNVSHQETKREKKTTSVKGRPHSPNQGPVVGTVPLSNIDARHEQRMSSGFRRNGNQNNRFGRGHETRGDWSSSGQDDRQQTQPVNRERQRHNLHYEYQPVGHGPSRSSSRANNYEGPKEFSNNAGGRYRERGPNHPRRGGGNFHGRQSGAVRGDGGYD